MFIFNKPVSFSNAAPPQAIHKISVKNLAYASHWLRRKVLIARENFFFCKLNFVSFTSLHGHTLEANVATSSGQESKSKFVNLKSKQTATIYLQSTRNNTICTLVNGRGETVSWNSAGSIGFKNTRKSTTYAAQAVAEKIAAKGLEKGFFSVRVLVKGLGYGKQSGVRALFKSGLKIVSIEEITPVSYNGSRPRKKRRV